jgi:asparagine synthase (glutamine-hydrolysing)
MWAFAIHDRKLNKIILSRDRFSKKPLFFHEDDNVFYFSSEIKQIIPLVKNQTPNKQILYSYLKQGVLDYSNETFFDSIFRLEGKFNLVIDLKTKAKEKIQYWDYDHSLISVNNIEDEFRFLLEDSVNLRLRSDVPVGTMLSGGLDSSAITLLASNAKSDIETFSVVSKDKETSEEPFIDLMTKHLNLKNTKLEFNANHVLSNLDEVIKHQDEPFFNLSVLASYSILKKIKDETNITVLLNGQGGDELLMGYLKYFFFYQRGLLKNKNYGKAISLVLSAIFNRTIVNQFNFGKAKRYIPGYLSQKSNYLIEDGFGLINTWNSNSMRSRQISDIDQFSIPVLCRYEDRNSTAHSLEMRVPFLDYRLVNFCINLSETQKINKGWTKFILRKTMTDLPHEIRYRRDKKGFTIPEESFLRNQLNTSIMSMEKYSILHEWGLINKNNFINYYKDFLNGKSLFIEFTDITRVFIAESWARKYFKN